MTELEQQLQEANKLSQTPPPSVTSAATQTQQCSELTAKTTSADSNHHVRVGGSQLSSAPSHHQGVEHGAGSDLDVRSLSALLYGAVEVQNPEVLYITVHGYSLLPPPNNKLASFPPPNTYHCLLLAKAAVSAIVVIDATNRLLIH